MTDTPEQEPTVPETCSPIDALNAHPQLVMRMQRLVQTVPGLNIDINGLWLHLALAMLLTDEQKADLERAFITRLAQVLSDVESDLRKASLTQGVHQAMPKGISPNGHR